jgi:hypothetical protein
VWIEVSHSLGLDPVPAGACALSADFLGDQWSFLKFPLEDLRELYGLLVEEVNVWRPLPEHVEEHLAGGRLVTIEVDSWFLPDTAGSAYRTDHVKSTIIPNVIDCTSKRLAYFHSVGYWELSGNDFDGALRIMERDSALPLPPYAEVVRLDRIRRHDDLFHAAVALAKSHLERMPSDNPVERMGRRVAADQDWLAKQGIDTFHRYAFGTVRQCGATAELASTFLEWLVSRGVSDLAGPAALFAAVACGAKSLQFRLSRLGRGRTVAVDDALVAMAHNWSTAMAGVVAWADRSGG